MYYLPIEAIEHQRVVARLGTRTLGRRLANLLAGEPPTDLTEGKA
jgi:hypothetical protein